MDIRDACAADWRAFDGYRYTVEHSVYVHSDARGRGVRRHLVTVLIARARELGKHVMVAGIEADNVASSGLREKLGFTTSGRLPQVGVNFDRWLDLTFMQLLLDERPAAVRRGVAGGPPGQRAPQIPPCGEGLQ